MPAQLIHFPVQVSTATRHAASQAASVVQISTARRRGAPQLQEIRASAASNLPALIEDVKLDIVSRWRRGVQIAYIAKMFQLTVRQVEAVLWVHLYGDPHDPAAVTPTVRESRRMHVVARAA